MGDVLPYRTLLTIAVPVATYLGGLLTEPAKKWLSTRTDRKRLKNAVYSELAGNLNHLVPYIYGIQVGVGFPYPSINVWLRLDVYQDALSKQPILFNEIQDSKAILELYMALGVLKDLAPAEQQSRLALLKDWINLTIDRGLISRRLLKRHHISLHPSLFDLRHPIVIWLEKLYRRIINRNVEWQGKWTAYMPATTLTQKLKAIYRGIPGEHREMSEQDIKVLSDPKNRLL